MAGSSGALVHTGDMTVIGNLASSGNVGGATLSADGDATIVGDIVLGENAKSVGYGTAAPTTGTYGRGSIVFNDSPSAGGTVGWSCVVAGSPGTWKTFGTISA